MFPKLQTYMSKKHRISHVHLRKEPKESVWTWEARRGNDWTNPLLVEVL